METCFVNKLIYKYVCMVFLKPATILQKKNSKRQIHNLKCVGILRKKKVATTTEQKLLILFLNQIINR